MNKDYFIALTGAKKNVGDFLITERALTLLENIAPEFDYIKYPSWELLTDIKLINKSKGIIILGGPGFQMSMYPGVYKLRPELKEIQVPIFPLGLGWFGRPGDKTTEKLYKFSDASKSLIDYMENADSGMSCRDYQTLRVLENNGYKNVKMTGCPVWYDLPSLNKEFVVPKAGVKKIVFTPAQDYIFAKQSMEVMKFLTTKFSNSEIIVSFHRGIGKTDEYTSELDALNTKKLADYAIKLGLQVIDTSYNTEKLKFYDDCDLHIGYRVHAHIYFLSKRLPSLLIHEDGRGNGVTEALKSPGINGYYINKVYSKIFSIFRKNIFLLRVYNKICLDLNPSIINELDTTLNDIQKEEYDRYKETSKIIDENYKVMEKYILSITRGIK